MTAAIVLALAAAGGAAALSDSYNGVAFSPFTLAPGNMDCVPSHDDVVGWTANCDPINLIFPFQSLDVAVARLHAAGWTDAGGSTQWIYFGTGPLVAVQAQLQLPDGSDPTMRYHVRLWQAAPNLVVGNVHHEHGSPHQIDMAWDAAEAFLASGVCSARCSSAFLPTQDSIERSSGSWRGWANNAYATVIAPAPPVAPSAPSSSPPVRHKKQPHRRAAHGRSVATPAP